MDYGSLLDVVDMQESRLYSALAFSAFKNHTICFKIILEHAKKFNLPVDKNENPLKKSL